MSRAVQKLIAALTLPEVARVCRVRKATAYEWVERHGLRAVNVANPGQRPRLVVMRDDLERFLAGRQVGQAAKPRRRVKKSAATDFYPDA